MNVTFLIGNGFDRNLGLSTTYAKFVKEYKTLNPPTKIIKEFRNYIKGNEELWSSAEVALGQYTAQLESGRGAAFSECHTDICEELAKYLKKQQKRIDYDISPEKAQNALASLNNIVQPFPTQEASTLHAVFDKHKNENTVFNFINFNYTNTLDNLLKIAKKNPDILGSHQYLNKRLKHTLGNICSVHGTVEGEMVFGVNDESQIANNSVFECEDGDLYKKLLIKQQANATYLENTDEKALKILNNSHLIYIYGMSIGETDKLWWNRICTWLNGSSDRHVILNKFSMPEKGVLPAKYQIAERMARRKITQYCDLNEISKQNIEARIHVTNHNIFADIDSIAMSEEEAVAFNSYLSVLAEIEAQEMNTRETLPIS